MKNLLIKLWQNIKPYFTRKMFPIALTVWLAINGIWYVFAFAPIFPQWLRIFSASYLTVLWLPCTPEKLIEIPLILFIYRVIYKEEFKKGTKL